MTLTYKEPTDPIQVSEADMRHHLKYIGRTGEHGGGPLLAGSEQNAQG